MYHGKFAIGEWHEINVWRKNCDLTEIIVDGGHKLVDHADEFKVCIQLLNLTKSQYLNSELQRDHNGRRRVPWRCSPQH